jgi:3-methyladenine DNA glycosylase Mpg
MGGGWRVAGGGLRIAATVYSVAKATRIGQKQTRKTLFRFLIIKNKFFTN